MKTHSWEFLCSGQGRVRLIASSVPTSSDLGSLSKSPEAARRAR